MSIRRRLIISLSAILVLFAVDQGIVFWSARLRDRTIQTLNRGLSRQIAIGSIRHDLDSVYKQVSLLSQMPEGDLKGGLAPGTRLGLRQGIEGVRQEISHLQELADDRHQAAVASLAAGFDKVAGGWTAAAGTLGVNSALASAELIRSEPMARRLLAEDLPNLEVSERKAHADAEAELERVSRLTQQAVLAIFGLSTLVGIWVAYRVSKYITDRIGDLIQGANLVGSGVMDYRIPVSSNDELGRLAQAFNDMSTNLVTASQNLVGATTELETRAQEVQTLLRNILPEQIAIELRKKGSVDPMYFEDVTIVFTDFVGFTSSTEKLAAEDLVLMLHDYFTAFDQIVAKYHLEKLKTIGDSYMCVGGLPVGRRRRRTPSHPVDAVMAAFEMVRAVQERAENDNRVHWAVRVGAHTGPVIAGVVGIHKFAFDVWGESVNYASRMESSGSPNRINLSAATFQRVKDFFRCEYRGKVLTKEKREFDMYFADGILPELLDPNGGAPPEAFQRRYRVYFQKEMPAFPGFLVPAAAPAVEADVVAPTMKLEASGE
jgi:class 3 adenylate cyclase